MGTHTSATHAYFVSKLPRLLPTRVVDACAAAVKGTSVAVRANLQSNAVQVVHICFEAMCTTHREQMYTINQIAHAVHTLIDLTQDFAAL